MGAREHSENPGNGRARLGGGKRALSGLENCNLGGGKGGRFWGMFLGHEKKIFCKSYFYYLVN